MIIEWKQQRLNVISIKPRTASEQKKASGKSQIILLPGTNEVDDGDWDIIEGLLEDQIKVGNILVHALKEKVIEQIDGKPVKQIKRKAIPFKDLAPDKAVEIIKECNDPKTLKKWLKKAIKDEIRLSIKERIDEIDDFINAKPED